MSAVRPTDFPEPYMGQVLRDVTLAVSPRRAPLQAILVTLLIAATAFGLVATPHAATVQAIMDAGKELTHLLRAMALLKVVIVAGAAWLLGWRLCYPASPTLTAAYLASLAAIAAGPGLIWGMVHVLAGAVLMHGGLAMLLILFWRDPGSPAMLPWASANRP